jgi:hypothetical protein
MRLVDYSTEGLSARTTGRDRVCARDLLADAPAAFLSGVGTLVVALILGAVYGLRIGVVVGLLGVACVALVLFWRGAAQRNWIVAVTPTAVMIQIFRKIGFRASTAGADNIIELKPNEIAEVSPGLVDIVWSSLRRQRIRYLFVELRVDNPEGHAIISSLADFSGYSCAVPRQRVAIVHDRRILIEWSYRRPAAKDFLKNAQMICPLLRVVETKILSVDFTDLIMMP